LNLLNNMPIRGTDYVLRTLGDIQGAAREREQEAEGREDRYYRNLGDELERNPPGPRKPREGFGRGDEKI
jgi:hypothetical protein